MNRKKKMNATLKKRNKKEKAKLAPKTKSSYISKAKRALLELEDSELESNETVKEGIVKHHGR